MFVTFWCKVGLGHVCDIFDINHVLTHARTEKLHNFSFGNTSQVSSNKHDLKNYMWSTIEADFRLKPLLALEWQERVQEFAKKKKETGMPKFKDYDNFGTFGDRGCLSPPQKGRKNI